MINFADKNEYMNNFKIIATKATMILVAICSSPAITLAGSAQIFSDFQVNPSAGGSGIVNLNSYGVSSVLVDIGSDAYGASQLGGNVGYGGYAEAVIGSKTYVQSVPNGSDPMSVSALLQLTFTKSGAIWTSNEGVNMGSTISVNANASVWGNDSQGTGSAYGWAYWTDPTVGTIAVSSNIAGANWTITGPEAISGSGASANYPSKPTGMYTITYGAVSGYTAPATQSFNLASGATITFSGTYTAVAPSVNLWFQ